MGAVSLEIRFSERYRKGHECMVTINTDSEYFIITKVSEEVLENTDKIVLKYVAPKLESQKYSRYQGS